MALEFVYYLYFCIFFMSVFSILFTTYDLFVSLIYLELSYLSLGIICCITSLLLDDRFFEVFSVVLMALAGAESAIAISLLVSMNRLSIQLTASEFSTLKGLD